MAFNSKANPSDFAAYLQTVVKLDALDRMTQIMDAELEESQNIMSEINIMFNEMPDNQNAPNPPNHRSRDEDLNFLEEGVPNLLLPDMVENTSEVDMDVLITTLKGHAEQIKRSIVYVAPRPKISKAGKDLSNMNLDQYRASLDHLNKRLATINLDKENINKCDQNLEPKLAQLCEDINMFTELVEAKKTLSEANKETPPEPGLKELQYVGILNKLLLAVNEITYIMQNQN